jgi:hypothetical protein
LLLWYLHWMKYMFGTAPVVVHLSTYNYNYTL